MPKRKQRKRMLVTRSTSPLIGADQLRLKDAAPHGLAPQFALLRNEDLNLMVRYNSERCFLNLLCG
jgi:hypothetical protein